MRYGVSNVSRAAAAPPAVQGAGQGAGRCCPVACPRWQSPRAIGFLARVSGFRKSGPAKTAWLCSPPIGRCKPLNVALDPPTREPSSNPASTQHQIQIQALVFLHWLRALCIHRLKVNPSPLPWPSLAASTASVERAVSNCLPMAARRLSGTEAGRTLLQGRNETLARGGGKNN
jgi:hypothetical protein